MELRYASCFFVAQALHVLQQMQPDHKLGRQTSLSSRLMITGAESRVEAILLNQRGQPDQLMCEVEDRLQRGAEQIAVWRFEFAGTHHSPRRSISLL